MKHSTIILFSLIICSLCIISCGTDVDPDIDTVPDAHFTWDINGQENIAIKSQRFAINTDFYYIYGASAAGGPQISIKLNNDNGVPVASGNSFVFDENSPHELSYIDGAGGFWTSKNAGSSATLNIASYQELENVININAFIEGNFSGTLISSNNPDECLIENGDFAIKENG